VQSTLSLILQRSWVEAPAEIRRRRIWLSEGSGAGRTPGFAYGLRSMHLGDQLAWYAPHALLMAREMRGPRPQPWHSACEILLFQYRLALELLQSKLESSVRALVAIIWRHHTSWTRCLFSTWKVWRNHTPWGVNQADLTKDSHMLTAMLMKSQWRLNLPAALRMVLEPT
jgi:hypothetical protein